jgi:hypothetical protein
MHKLSVFGLSLVMFLFLAATTSSMPIRASAFEMDDARQNYDLYYNGEETYSQVDRYQQSYDSYGQSYEDPYQQSYDSYEDMYSKYPTKDKKFVCEEGPLKGFFVVKPKFCDIELPPGPAGPQGPEGPAGQINFTNTYIVVGTGGYYW